jgi:hypothetical protein
LVRGQRNKSTGGILGSSIPMSIGGVGKVAKEKKALQTEVL